MEELPELVSYVELSEKEVKDADETNFRLQNQFLLLTYKTHIDKAEFKAWVAQRVSCNVKHCIIAHEKASSLTQYEHSHIYLAFDKAFQTRNARFFDFNDIHPNIKKVVTNSKIGIYRYLSKEDEAAALECKPLIKYEPIALRVWDAPTLCDAMQHATRFGDATGIATIYNLKPLPKCREYYYEMYGWQRELRDYLLNTEPDPRKVIWCHEEIGNTGKTTFVKYMCARFYEDTIFFADTGKMSDLAQILRNKLNEGWSGKTILINLAKATHDRTSVYQMIEYLKDGLITCMKYNGTTLLINPPHLVLFANYAPEVGRISLDRWDIRRISRPEIPESPGEGVEPFPI